VAAGRWRPYSRPLHHDAPEIRADNVTLAPPAAVNADSPGYSAVNVTLALGGAASETLSVWR
jgi:hypothetical protein